MHIGLAVRERGQSLEVHELAGNHEGGHVRAEVEDDLLGCRLSRIEQVEGRLLLMIEGAAVLHALDLAGGLLDLAQLDAVAEVLDLSDRKSTRLNSSHPTTSRMPSSA